ncbi:probable sterigmatocystin biosynthesis P450 monooxygenase stcF [Aspergillus awamori]|uniref:Probable sterigmatocystin biosynthesis P450 monooxygenase stcF n=1 Tax=Aspergillus awamori TaxID=105351 RepID=A0A401L637_ASPAW|nr:probable sterigmatocystin biosynthesis P450 monooxygenase stcF [Aspergillus awamori]GKZ59134.1 hypothetical protein AnigIFM49718_004994 [Aspergillus niger]GLA07525.1 hypothetical protein AnigIFM60653_008758 [Aspergillus niger]
MALNVTTYATIVTVLLLPVLLAIKRLYFHPLSRYDGPRLWALTRLPYMLAFRSGRLAHDIKRFHDIYGDTVRVGPDEVSFLDPDCIKDIYSRRPNNPHYKALPKDPIRQKPPQPGQPGDILDVEDDDHSRIRKAYAPAFSTQALNAQKPLVTSYVCKMVAQLKSRANSTDPSRRIVDLQRWVTYCTFDIICSLSFGEDFGCLDNDSYHEWVGMVVNSVKGKVQIAAFRFYPWLFNYLVKSLPKSAQLMVKRHQAMTNEKVQKRLHTAVDRPDFFSYLLKSKNELTEPEMEINAATFIFAGSHTLQSSLTGILFHLLKNPEALARVAEEVRSNFPDEGDLDANKLSKLPLLDAAIKEGIRLTAPVPLGITRLVPRGGHTVCGQYFPEGSKVSYNSWAAGVSLRNFAEPTKFHLGRWLNPDEGRFANDRRSAIQPFLQGPRDCIGQNLARLEMSLVVGYLIYHFDFVLPNGREALGEWEDQETYAVWMKSPLMVELVAR